MQHWNKNVSHSVGIFFVALFISACSLIKSNNYANYTWVSPNGWGGGVFDVPTWFAPDMPYTGQEIIRFHDDFYEADKEGFWTYTFAMLIDQTKTPTTQDILDETHRYFVGLSRFAGGKKDADYPADKVIVKAVSDWKISADGKRRSQYYTLQTYDSFTSGESIKLNMKVTSWLCSKTHRAFLYSFSLRETHHPLWKQLDEEANALQCS